MPKPTQERKYRTPESVGRRSGRKRCMKRRHVTWGAMAVLLNQTSNLRVRIELLKRLSDGSRAPASLEMQVGVERYENRHPRFAPLILGQRPTQPDMDRIQVLQSAEQLPAG